VRKVFRINIPFTQLIIRALLRANGILLATKA
jgi:hypothetical protein